MSHGIDEVWGYLGVVVSHNLFMPLMRLMKRVVTFFSAKRFDFSCSKKYSPIRHRQYNLALVFIDMEKGVLNIFYIKKLNIL